MAEVSWTELPERGVVALAGAEAKDFLHNLVTTSIERVAERGAGYGGLLTPQGKILFDFLIFAGGDFYLLDAPRKMVPDLVRRLGFYRLRAQVDIAVRDDLAVAAAWGGGRPELAGATVAADPRLDDLGWRIIAPPAAFAGGIPRYTRTTPAAYAAHRIGLGVPEGGDDFAYGDAFPHDADMDQLGGIDFRKGCYVGQEVVSRMQHRGTARRRTIAIAGEGLAPGAPVEAAGRALGTVGSVADGRGVAMIRLDRAKEALDAGQPITAGGAPVTLAIPEWAEFGWPQTVAAED
jgi:folate-binding protein YgfZ